MASHAGNAKYPSRRPHRRRSKRRSNNRNHNDPSLYRLRDFTAAYFLAMATILACLIFLPPLLIFVYPFSGICMSRFIGRRIIWWNQANSIENVSAAKVHMVLTWPLSVPIFIGQIFIVKFL